jgi:hypothetical protein
MAERQLDITQDDPSNQSDSIPRDVSAIASSESRALNVDKLLTTLNGLAIIGGGLWALFEWHDFRQENGQLTLKQQGLSLTQTSLQIRSQELQTEQSRFAVSQQGLAKLQQELAVKQQMLQLEQEKFAVKQLDITREQQGLAVEMAKASLSYQRLQNDSTIDKLHQRRFDATTDLKIVRIAADETNNDDRQLYKVWFEFHLKNTSDKPFTVCYNITDVFIAPQSNLIGSEAIATHVPFPPAVADNFYNAHRSSPWQKVAGEAYVYQGGSEDRCDGGNFMTRAAGYDSPVQGGGGTNIVQPGGTSSNSPVYIVRARPTDWVAVSVTFSIGSRYEFISRYEPFEPGIGERSIERWHGSDSK